MSVIKIKGDWYLIIPSKRSFRGIAIKLKAESYTQ